MIKVVKIEPINIYNCSHVLYPKYFEISILRSKFHKLNLSITGILNTNIEKPYRSIDWSVGQDSPP